MTDQHRAEKAWAHEIVPHPGEGGVKPLAYLVRYHYCQARAWHLAFAEVIADSAFGPRLDFALSQYLGHSHLAFLHDALAQGLPGEAAAAWASARCHSESAELVWERSVACGLDPDAVRPYRTEQITSPAEQDCCGAPRRYFPQQTCYLERGHGGQHEDDTHLWGEPRTPPGMGSDR